MADTGKKALEILDRRQEEISLMLLDLVMPEMDGFRVLEEVKTRPWSSHLAIIIISSDSANKTEKRCFDLGVSDFIHRPFDERLVRRRVNNIVSLFQYQEGLERTIAIPDSILLKPGRFTEEEFECMKAHTTRGCELLSNIKDTWDQEYRKVSYDICRHHHERYDGKGYPDGLKGEDIPISAQIVSLADVYDALVNERVYKSAFSREKAFRMIMTGECGVFSPKLLDCFRSVRKEFERLADTSL